MAASIAVMRAEQQPTFRASVDVVRIDVSVMNGLSPVAGLKAANFVVTDNGVPQTLDSVSLDRFRSNLMLVLDTSGSLAGERLTNLIDAVNGLVKSLRAEDAASLLTFSEPIRLAVKTTREREPLISALTGLVADGSTSVNDAIFLALQLRPADAGESRPVLLLFSDGRDTSSWLRSDHVIEATKRSGMLVHVVELVADEWMGTEASRRGRRRFSACWPIPGADGDGLRSRRAICASSSARRSTSCARAISSPTRRRACRARAGTTSRSR